MKMISIRRVVGPTLQMTARCLATCFLLSLLARPALACTCLPVTSAPACQLVGLKEVVFLGESVEVVPLRRERGYLYRFRVDRIYKGLDPAVKELLVDPDNVTTCSASYPTKKKYLIFASLRRNKPLIVLAGTCSGSREVSGRQSDIDFLENYAGGKTDTEVYGKVLQYVRWFGRPSESESDPLEGAVVVLANATHRFEFISQSDGSFRFSGIPPGDYQLSATLDPYLPDPSSRKISVVKGGCNETFIQLKAMAALSGALYTHDNQPAARIGVELLKRHRSGGWYYTSEMLTHTDDQGRFHFRDLESGEYLLGYQICSRCPVDESPYPRQYFPGVADLAQAEVIKLLPQQTLTGLNFTLPPPLTRRQIMVKVIGQDGRFPGKNLLQILGGRGFVENLEGDAHGGVATFTGYEEREHKFRARYWIDNLLGPGPGFSKRIVVSEFVTVPPGKGPVEIVLTLSKVMLSDEYR